MADYAASYCERCGTRFTFGSSSSVGAPLRDARVLAKGLKHFVLSNSGSIGDAMAYARNDVQSSESLRVTQLFHKTFNFCMTCRQYACDNCWNEAQGACLSCAPDSAISPMEPTDLLLVRTPVSRLEPGPDGSPPRLGDPIGPTSTRPEMPAWPVQDILIADAGAPDGDERAAAAASGAESTRQANRTLWPIQDDLDAERLDLTPEELALVEGQLEHMAPRMLADSTDASSPEEESAAPASPIELSLTVADAAPAPAPFTAQEDATTADADQVAAEREPVRAERLVEANVQPWPDATPWSVRPIQSRGHVVGPILVERTGLPADAVAEQLPAAAEFEAAAEVPVSSSTGDRRAEPDATADGRAEPEAAAEPVFAAEPEFAPEPEPVFAAAPEPVFAAEPEFAPEPEPVFAAEPEPVFIAEPEATVEPEPVFIAEPEATAQAEPPSLPQWSRLPDWPSDTAWQIPLATPDEATEPVAEAPEDASPIESPSTEPAAIPAAPVQQPLDLPATSVDRWAAAAPAPATEVGRTSGDLPAAWPPIGASWPVPAAPRAPWPGPQPAALPAAIVAAQQAAQQAGPAIWAASSQEVISHGNVRACHHCALPVSTHARFCRRCGTQQG